MVPNKTFKSSQKFIRNSVEIHYTNTYYFIYYKTITIVYSWEQKPVQKSELVDEDPPDPVGRVSRCLEDHESRGHRQGRDRMHLGNNLSGRMYS